MPRRKIEMVIFDLDGTLVDAYKAVAKSLNRALKDRGYPAVPNNVIKKKVGWGEKILVRNFVDQKDIVPTLNVYHRYHQEDLKRGVKFLPGALRLIKTLYAQDFQLAVASNRPTFFTEIILKILNVRSYFRFVICGDKVKHPKPAGDILRAILKKASLKSGQVLYVGDMSIDVETGHRAGIKTVAVLTGSCTRKEIMPFRPFKMVDRISEVATILAAINGETKIA